MATTAERVVTEAMTLPPAQRAFVAEKLIESLEMPDTPPYVRHMEGRSSTALRPHGSRNNRSSRCGKGLRQSLLFVNKKQSPSTQEHLKRTCR